MVRRIFLMIGFAVALAGAAYVGVRLAAPAEEPPKAESNIVTAKDATELRAELSAPAPPDPVPAANALQGEDVATLTAYATGGDAAKRAEAIAALADAPSEEAVPVLGRILTDGEPEVDRPLALRALRDLAQNQGDTDGKIRDAVRNAIYHGDDFTKVAEVQAVLDAIEKSQQGQ